MKKHSATITKRARLEVIAPLYKATTLGGANIAQIIGFRLFPTENYCIKFAKKDGVNISYLIFFNLVTCKTQGGRYYWTPFGDGVGITDTINRYFTSMPQLSLRTARRSRASRWMFIASV